MLSTIDYLITHKKIRLLNGFSDKECQELLSLGHIKAYETNEIILTENQDDMNIYLLIEGEASVWKKKVPIYEFKRGAMFNETKIYSPRSNSFTVMADEKAVVLEFSRDDILNYFSFKPERLFKIFTLNVISILLNTIENREEQIIGFYYQSMQMMKESL